MRGAGKLFGPMVAAALLATVVGARADALDGDMPALPAVGIGTDGRGTGVAPESAVPRGNPLWALPLASLGATRDRPLFSPSRRPPPAVLAPPVVAPPPPAPTRPPLSLIGTVVGADESYAIFQEATSSAIVRLRSGEAHQGWVLRAVGLRDVMLQGAAGSAVLALPARDSQSAGAPSARAAAGTLASAQPGALKVGGSGIVVPRKAADTAIEYHDH